MGVAARAAAALLVVTGCGNADALLEQRAETIARSCLTLAADRVETATMEMLADRLETDLILSYFENSDGPRRSTLIVMRAACRVPRTTLANVP